jgi:hypothetical protein
VRDHSKIQNPALNGVNVLTSEGCHTGRKLNSVEVGIVYNNNKVLIKYLMKISNLVKTLIERYVLMGVMIV